MTALAHVLVVDDNEANAKLLAFMLTKRNYSVRVAIDADAAERAIEAQRPDIVLMDVQLPRVDGLTLTRKLRAAPATEGLLIVAVTASAMKGDEQRARDAGCDGYLTKPIDIKRIAAQVAELLARRSDKTHGGHDAEDPARR